ncbi:MAG: hypothetical protein MPJ50_03355 [Pirellulales bacterium]|nr:hypothetical protein [Pirellulales bacterium]
MLSMPLPGVFWTLFALQAAGVTLALVVRFAERTQVHRLLQRLFFAMYLASGSCAICAFWWGSTVGIFHGVALAVMTMAAVFDSRITKPGAEPTW